MECHSIQFTTISINVERGIVKILFKYRYFQDLLIDIDIDIDISQILLIDIDIFQNHHIDIDIDIFGRSRNLALRLPGTRDRKRARRSTTSRVAWEFCCSGETLRFWETGSPTSHHHKLMDWMSKNLWFTISIALSLTQLSVHLPEIYPSPIKPPPLTVSLLWVFFLVRFLS